VINEHVHSSKKTKQINRQNEGIYKQEAQLPLGWADRTAYIRRPASDFRSRKESNFLECLQFYACFGDADISNASTFDCNTNKSSFIQSWLGYDAVIWRTWVMAAVVTLHSKLRQNRCRYIVTVDSL